MARGCDWRSLGRLRNEMAEWFGLPGARGSRGLTRGCRQPAAGSRQGPSRLVAGRWTRSNRRHGPTPPASLPSLLTSSPIQPQEKGYGKRQSVGS